jgi:hypothetical protein
MSNSHGRGQTSDSKGIAELKRFRSLHRRHAQKSFKRASCDPKGHRSNNKGSDPLCDAVLGSPTDLLVVESHINGHPAETLIDTGASSNYISQSCLDRLGTQGSEINLQPAGDINVLIADASTITPQGIVQLSITIDNIEYRTDFIVMETLLFETILGYRFIKTNSITIRTYQDDSVIITKNHSLSTPDIELFAAMIITIPPLSQQLIDMEWHDPPAQYGTYLVDRNDKLFEKRGLLVARGVVSINRNAEQTNESTQTLMVANLTHRPVRI